MSDGPILSVHDLETHYPVTEGVLRREVGRVRAVDGISFDLERGETLALVGESGCGKSTAARTVVGLEEPTAGTVRFDGVDVTTPDGRTRTDFHRRVSMVFQDPDSSFNPRMTVGEAVGEPLRIHGLRDADRERTIVTELLELVGLGGDHYDRYPHEFSGGQKQRLAIARALVTNPEVVVVDEPVSALDRRVQGTVLDVLADLQARFELSILFITHDTDVVRSFCDRVAVMYLGELVERGSVDAVFDDPAHPYTRALLDARPALDPADSGQMTTLTGEVGDPADPPSGCRFHPRCPAVIQSPGYDLPRDEWRAVLDFRYAIADAAADDDPVRTSDRSLRTVHDVPDPLSDPEAEAILSRALADVADGAIEPAVERLAESFSTVCEVEEPPEVSVDGRPVTCHRHTD
ncbi:ABC transporter ATP-binding protein [Halosolutus halophilus]|uniref:ABC transporter ATP-binding protein n=1 Tax=Halosolutus halophilus TaxID=1552990 RepID=UPI0022350553|nr:oligopeptide/dipeptide ABC transporter ATP-binding protein [Halosolutus halophilus]